VDAILAAVQDELDRDVCRLRVEIAPAMPATLAATLIQMSGSIKNGVQRFAAFIDSPDDFFRAKFDKTVLQVLEEQQLTDTPYTWHQLTGPTQSANKTRVFNGIVALELDGDVAFYENIGCVDDADPPSWRTNDDIENQTTFLQNVREMDFSAIWGHEEEGGSSSWAIHTDQKQESRRRLTEKRRGERKKQ
jgi:hypothetical protein